MISSRMRKLTVQSVRTKYASESRNMWDHISSSETMLFDVHCRTSDLEDEGQSCKADDCLYGISLTQNLKSLATPLLWFSSPHFHLILHIRNPGTVMLLGSKLINKKGEHNLLKKNTGKCMGKSKAHYHHRWSGRGQFRHRFTLCKV
jgi:hypothetical protein